MESRAYLRYARISPREFCTPRPQAKQKSKRKIRHKGYRDHGSLGSEVSRTLRDQRDDWSLRELEEVRKKEVNDYLALLRGISGLE